MTVWLVRAGSRGERETLALENDVAVIGWEELPDLSSVSSRDDLLALLQATYVDDKPKAIINWAGQIWPFLSIMQQGDLVTVPLKTRPVIAIGEVTGPYRHRPDFPLDARHTRPVRWLKEIPRDRFDQDLLYSLGAFMTVCRIQRNNAEQRIRVLLADGTPSATARAVPVMPEEVTEIDAPPDLEQLAKDQIVALLGRKFKGHDLAGLVGAILEAQGYKVRVSPPGADGGVDIIAGKGLLGFDSPKLVVQVKSGSNAVDVKVIRELQGVMGNFKADHGLLVSWGGYTSPALKETATKFFEIRLWDSEDLVTMIQTYYQDLPDAVQAELPLKRIWMLVPEEVE